jgi:hypothetical protein
VAKVGIQTGISCVSLRRLPYVAMHAIKMIPSFSQHPWNLWIREIRAVTDSTKGKVRLWFYVGMFLESSYIYSIVWCNYRSSNTYIDIYSCVTWLKKNLEPAFSVIKNSWITFITYFVFSSVNFKYIDNNLNHYFCSFYFHYVTTLCINF